MTIKAVVRKPLDLYSANQKYSVRITGTFKTKRNFEGLERFDLVC